MTSFLHSCLRVTFHHRAVIAQKDFYKAGDNLYLVSRGFFATWLLILQCCTHYFCDTEIHAEYQAYVHTKKPLWKETSS